MQRGSDLPLFPDFWLDVVAPLLHARDLLALSATSRAFRRLLVTSSESEVLWKRKIIQDCRFPV